MTALRQEAFELLESMPEDALSSIIHYMNICQQKTTGVKNHYLTDALTGIIPQDIDFDAERERLLREKYEIAD